MESIPLMDRLKKCRDKGTVVSIYSDAADPEKFSVGVILAVSPKWTAVDCLGTEGEYTGLSAIPTKSIYSIVYGDRYTKTVAAAWDGRQAGLCVTGAVEADPLCGTLEYAAENRLVADIEFAQSGCWDMTGYVRDISNGVAQIQPVDENGETDGECFCDMSVITWVDVRPGGDGKSKPGPGGVILFKSPDGNK